MWKRLIFALIAVLLGNWLYKFSLLMGYHVVIFNHSPGPCKILPGIENGAEDIELLPGDKALITSGLRFLSRDRPNFQGIKSEVYSFDFNKPENGVRPVIVRGLERLEESDFHGLSIFVDEETGGVTVFIVNHLVSSSVVEIFTYNTTDGALDHLETVGQGDGNFGVLNDVTAVGPRQFYATNSLYSRSFSELILQLRWGSVVFFDGEGTHVATKGLLLANGITHSLDGKYVHVIQVFEREMITYSRNVDNSLTVEERTPLYVLPDNINIDPETGDLWIGAHPVGHQSFAYCEDPTQISASMVLRLRTNEGHVTDVTSVLTDDGHMFSGSSVALYRKQQLLVGSVVSKLMWCAVRYV